MADDIQVKISAQLDELVAGLNQSTQALQSSFSQMQGSVSSLSSSFNGQLKESTEQAAESLGGVGETVEGIKSKLSAALQFAGVGIAVEGIKKLAEALGEAAERAEQIKDAAAQFGVTTTQMQGLGVMAAQAGVESDRLQMVMSQLQEKMAQAGEEGGEAAERFNALGITTEQLRDPAFSVMQAMEQLGSAANSNTALMTEFGGRSAEIIPVLRELAASHTAAGDAARQVGALTDAEISDLERYHSQVILTSTAWENFKSRVLSGAVPAMGALLQTIQQFSSSSENAAEGSNMLSQAISFAVEEVIAFIGQVKDVTAAFFALWQMGSETFTQLGKAIEDALSGHFSAAAGDVKAVGSQISSTWGQMFDNFKQNAKEAGDEFNGFLSNQLNEVEVTAQKMGGMGTSLLPDLSTGKGADQATQQWQKSSEQLVKDHEQAIQQMMAADQQYLNEQVKATETGAKSGLDTQVSSINQQIAALQNAYQEHQVSAKQELQGTQQLLQQELQARMQYYQQLESLAQGNQAKLAQLGAQEGQAQQTYLTQMQKAQQQYTERTQQAWQQMGNRMSAVISQNFSKVVAGTETMGKAMQNIFSSVAQSMIQSLVKVGVQMMVNAMLSKETGKSAAKSNILSNAAQAASGAMASAAAIPYIGWLIAPVEGAAIYAAALAFPGAAQGWDIPAGINPVTQLHGSEMVLPAHLADSIRKMTSPGSGSTHHHYSGDVHISGISDHGLRKMFSTMSGRSALMKAATTALRRGARPR